MMIGLTKTENVAIKTKSVDIDGGVGETERDMVSISSLPDGLNNEQKNRAESSLEWSTSAS